MATRIELFPDTCRKTYIPDETESEPELRARFLREVTAYATFSRLEAPFVPLLQAVDCRALSFTTTRVDGRTLKAVLEDPAPVDLGKISSALAQIDRFLYRARIDVHFTDLKDLILEAEVGRLFLVDFEFSEVGKGYTSFLFDIANSKKLSRLEDQSRAEAFRMELNSARRGADSWLWRTLSRPVRRRLFRRDIIASKRTKDLIGSGTA